MTPNILDLAHRHDRWIYPGLAYLGMACALAMQVGCDDTPSRSRASTAQAPRSTEDSTSISVTRAQPQQNEFKGISKPGRQPIELELYCNHTGNPPTIDGSGNDPAWSEASPIETFDYASGRPVTIRSVHTSDAIFMLVTYPDGAPSMTHKTWYWDPNESVYKPDMDREDVFVFKWSMSGNDVDLSFHNIEELQADIWFWKACRTNRSGYADDKSHVHSREATDRALPISSASGTIYLMRIGDKGKSAYAESMPFDFAGATVPKYAAQTPEGSRGDVRAKGQWADGAWTIEFKRKLNTNHDDDQPFETGGRYVFAISCYEMAATGINRDWTQPLYRCGDVFDRLFLNIN